MTGDVGGSEGARVLYFKISTDKILSEFEKIGFGFEKAEFEAAKELEAQNLPVSFARMVASSDKDVMLENIASFKKEYMKAVEAGLGNRLKGTLPRISKEKEGYGDPFLTGLGM